ncbi:MAG: hypothetical protein HC840_06300 [Leptolyngbyaceae cyanobacterium RM2_2_4]|nr:hypothetical protein [Leptolyngbyaceae cyanobacterium SM1_4_3]NJO49134.1 hypothetical protein [Leptolyngbyaceae cyanobacterium RM2_2_4]NJO66515.1 hypothetical protein [Leptolyngbyaceae cyanobacterium RM1_405_57]
MELLFTQATVVVELFGAGYVAGSFAIYAHRRLSQPTSWRSRSTFTIVERVPEQEPEPKKPAQRKPTPVELLRQQCQKAGIKWRDAHGKNKHLKKAEMIAVLQQLERIKRVTVSQAEPTNSTKPKPTSTQKRAA